jgi:large subunit ribosomal protein L1
MAKLSKRMKEWQGELDREKKFDFAEAAELLKKYTKAKFKERFDVVIRLGIDPRKSDQMVRGSCSLPHGTGKEVRVLVFAKGDKEKEALDAGADFVGGDDMAQKIKDGWFEFDRVIAAPDMMGVVGKIGRILGPRGLMPNPKVGTVTAAVGETVKLVKKGQVQFKTDKGANIHATIGMMSFTAEQMKDNLQTFHDAIIKLKPATAKGTFIKHIAISSTMGPGLKLDPFQFKP